jgi:hypothetical protein
MHAHQRSVKPTESLNLIQGPRLKQFGVMEGGAYRRCIGGIASFAGCHSLKRGSCRSPGRRVRFSWTPVGLRSDDKFLLFGLGEAHHIQPVFPAQAGTHAGDTISDASSGGQNRSTR